MHDVVVAFARLAMLAVGMLLALALLLVAVAWSAAASAQIVSLPCAPTIGGTPVGKVGIMTNRLGWHGHFYCLNPDTTITGVVWNCLHTNPKCSPAEALAKYTAVLTAADRTAAATAAWEANFSASACTNATGDQKLLCDIARYHMCANFPSASKPKSCEGITLPVIPDPPAVTWRVLKDPFGSSGRRLVYTVAVVQGTTKRGVPVSPARYVDPGAPCDQITRVDEPVGIVFMSVLGDPSLIARCAP